MPNAWLSGMDPHGSFRKLGVRCFGVLIILGPLFSETPICPYRSLAGTIKEPFQNLEPLATRTPPSPTQGLNWAADGVHGMAATWTTRKDGRRVSKGAVQRSCQGHRRALRGFLMLGLELLSVQVGV